jgi:CBS domain-containing protein
MSISRSRGTEDFSVPTIAGLVPITDIMSRSPVTARPDADAEGVIGLLRSKHVGCVPIVDEDGRPLGIVTKLDVLECGVSRGTARELMMPLAFTLGERATVAQAAGLMSAEAIHHVLVVDEDLSLIGVVSSLDIAHWLARNDSAVEPARL